MRNTTINLPDELIRHAKIYAATHNTSLTALIRSHLESLTGCHTLKSDTHNYLLEFSQGKISKERAIRSLGLRDYAELLQALGRDGLSLPVLPENDIKRMAHDFVRTFKGYAQ